MMRRVLTYKPIPARFPGLTTWVRRLGVGEILVVPNDGIKDPSVYQHVHGTARQIERNSKGKMYQQRKNADGSVSVERVQ
jgi:hypothetical protein